MNGKRIRYFSMFTGVGGFELGLERTSNIRPIQQNNTQRPEECDNTKNQPLKWKCMGMSEIDKYASELLKNKFPNVKNYGDATKINPGELPDFDMLVGGFPCQAFSIAGKRRGFEDTRGTLFFEVARIIEAKKPQVVLLENVKGLLNHNKGETFSVILETLDELGYETQWMVLNSKFFGVPQNRERVFIIGSLRGTSRPKILPLGESDTRDAEKRQTFTTITRSYHKGASQTLQANEVAGVLDVRGGQHPHATRMKDQSPTLTEAMGKGGGHIPIINTIRRLTPVECERLQGFPDGWTEGFSDTQRYKMMGNAVTVNVIKAIGERLAVIKKEEEVEA